MWNATQSLLGICCFSCGLSIFLCNKNTDWYNWVSGIILHCKKLIDVHIFSVNCGIEFFGNMNVVSLLMVIVSTSVQNMMNLNRYDMFIFNMHYVDTLHLIDCKYKMSVKL